MRTMKWGVPGFIVPKFHHLAGLAVTSVTITLALAPAPDALAAPYPEAKVPAPLQTWIPWVLDGHETRLCPFFHGGGENLCAWPSRLELGIQATTGTFRQTWTVFVPQWVPLPGDESRWPQDVRINGLPAVTIDQEGPAIYVQPGSHTIEGRFYWDSMPEQISVPRDTGIVALTLNGATVPFPYRDDESSVWLMKRASEEDSENSLEITVNRRITDEVPLQITTRVELAFAGKAREELLGQALPPGFVPMTLESEIPVRLEPDGRLRVQGRPGNWIITMAARSTGVAKTFQMGGKDGPWASQEIWVYESRPALRVAEISGVVAIDPQQTRLPDDWKSYPAYRVGAGETLTLTEQRRGDSDPAPDRISLQREIWLDADGGGYTLRDNLRGTLSRSWRLEMNPPFVLGRVAIDGKDQFITSLGGSGKSGVELRTRQFALVAESRLNEGLRDLPAIGWDHDLYEVSMQLNLPAGWKLFSASGADSVDSTWIQSWTLWDLFLVLILTFAVAHLWGWAFGGLALATLVLIFPESDSPQWAWLYCLALEALRRVLPTGTIHNVATAGRWIAVIALIAIAIPFMVMQARTGMYPVLERPWQTYSSGAGFAFFGDNVARAPSMEKAYDQAPTEAEVEQKLREPMPQQAAEGTEETEDFGVKGGMGRGKMALKRKAPSAYNIRQQQNLLAVDPSLSNQTGFGLPDWNWRGISIRWNGPVEKTQTLGLYLVPPWLNLILAFLRVMLTAALLLRLVISSGEIWQRLRGWTHAGATATVLALAFLPGTALAQPAEDAVPTNEILEELRERLMRPPECHPNCAAFPRMIVEIVPASMRIRLEVDAVVASAVPLPGSSRHWLPAQVYVDGKPATGIARRDEGDLWLPVPAGKHQVILEGPLPQRESVQIPLALTPHRVEAKAKGWTIAGIHEDGIADDNLELTREATGEEGGTESLEAQNLPPFVRIERSLALGLVWEAETRVVRMTPLGSAFVAEVPLIEGESVTTAGMRVNAGKVQVNMPPDASEIVWSSVLEARDKIHLVAPGNVPWAETWRLDTNPVWHVTTEGIPTIHANSGSLFEWRPWPGERVTVGVTRPKGVDGQTMTIDSSVLDVRPGTRATDATLTLQIRASRGLQHALTLPAGAGLQSLTINGQSQPPRQDGAKVMIPIMPGRQQVVLTWREPTGISLAYGTPAVTAGVPSVNTRVQVTPGADRWVLFAFGPRVGPAVLFWSLLAILLIAAVVLGRVRLTPLRTHHWFLLGIGLTQVPIPMSMLVAGWLLLMGLRRERPELSNRWFDLRQIVLAGLSFWAFVGIIWSVKEGLLGQPEMQITGNGSYHNHLHWYEDRTAEILPTAMIISVPIWVYRMLMLAWSLWLARAMMGWLRWVWQCYSTAGIWRPWRRKASPSSPPAPAG